MNKNNFKIIKNKFKQIYIDLKNWISISDRCDHDHLDECCEVKNI